jgi:tetratricopeptide (TPR) repeat protein
MSLIIGIHLIVRGEEDRIVECLRSNIGLADFFSIAVDSRPDSDKTYELCCDFVRDTLGAKAVEGIFRDEWQDSFGTARNNALQKTLSILDKYPNNLLYCGWVDSDDVWDKTSISHDEVRKRLQATQPDSVKNKYIYGFDYSVDPPAPSLTYYRTRIWKHVANEPPLFRWNGPAHEVEVKQRSINSLDPTWNDWVLVHRKGDNEGHRAGRTERNIKIFEKAVREEPNNARYCFYLGREYKDSGQFHKSIVSMQKYLNLSQFPAEKYQALMDMAYMYKWLGDLDNAEKTAREALHFKPEISEAAVLLGEICSVRNRWDLARSWFAYAIFAPHGEVLFDHLPMRTYIPHRWMAIACHYTGLQREAEVHHRIAKNMATSDPLIKYNDPWFNDNRDNFYPESLQGFFEASDLNYRQAVKEQQFPCKEFVTFLLHNASVHLDLDESSAFLEIGNGSSGDALKAAVLNPKGSVFVLDTFDDSQQEAALSEGGKNSDNLFLIKAVREQIVQGTAYGEGWIKDKRIKVVFCSAPLSNENTLRALIAFLNEPCIIVLDPFESNEVKIVVGRLLQTVARLKLIRRYPLASPDQSQKCEIGILVYS